MRVLSPLLILPLLACGMEPAPGSDSNTGTTRLGMGQGRLAIDLLPSSDEPLTAGNGKPAQVLASLAEIMVDIDEVTAHSSQAGWVVLRTEPLRVDILRLGESAVELGFADLPPGKVTQIRLHVAQDSNPYVTSASGETKPLKVPSGMQSGIKIKGTWDLDACQVNRVQVRFDRKNCLHVTNTGNDEQHILRPVIFASGSSYEDAVCEAPPEGEDPNDGPGGTPGGEDDPPTDGPLDPGGEGTPPDDGITPPGDGTTPPDDGSTPPAGTDPNAPKDPESGLCENGTTCSPGYYCGQTGVCIPQF